MKKIQLIWIGLFLITPNLLTNGIPLNASKSKWKQSKYSGFVQFAPGKFVSIYETSNGEFKEFIGELQDEALRQRYKPDSTLWVTMIPTGEANLPMQQVYFSHENYNDYPVSCITMEAMQAFCEWKSSKVGGSKRFRLPTSQEWKIFAAPVLGYKYPWTEDQPLRVDKNGTIEPLANLKIFDYSHNQFNYLFDGALYPREIKSYKPNRLGLYNVIGNVSEYTSDSLCKGGSCNNTMEESAIDLIQDYQLPNPFVGFRVVLEE
jgi:formylglycine-generating enzyme required for sulfatase activity